jgi:Holliday junction resolvase RusA-like endonuclease
MQRDPQTYFKRKFMVNLEPIRTTHQADLRILKTKDGRQFIGKMANSDIKAWIRDFKDAVLKTDNAIPDRPYEGPLEVSLYFGFPNIQADKGRVKPMTTKPDFDNLAKSVLDAMTDMGFWGDDSQIVYGHVSKFRTPHPFVGVAISPCNFIDEAFVQAIRDCTLAE